jgi:SSS family solute:Na+ symporter
MSVSIIDFIINIVYILATTLFGAWFVRKSKTLEGFTLADHLIPGWAIGLSLLATYLSSISFLANPGKSYTSDWRPFVFSLTLPIAIILAARFFIPLYRNTVKTTAYEYLEQRFGIWARLYMGAAYILLQIGRYAVVLYLIALALAAFLNTSISALILILGGLTIIYTLLGGFAAVIWTDVVQSIVLLAGGILCLLLIIMDIPGGWEQLLQTAVSHDKFSLGPMNLNMMIQGFWVIFIFGIVENIKNFSVDQNYIQRFLSASSEHEAVKSLWLGGLLYIPVSALFFLIGTALFVYYLHVPAFDLPSKPDQIFPFFIVNKLPTGMVGVVIAAVMAAGMSTLDSSLNSSSTVWTIDFYKRILRPAADDSKQLRTIRIATAVIGVIGTLAALFMLEVKTVLDIWWKISAIFGGGMLGLFLLGIIFKRVTSQHALLAVILGVIFTAWAMASPLLLPLASAWRFPLHPMLTGLAGTLVIVVSGVLISYVRK